MTTQTINAEHLYDLYSLTNYRKAPLTLVRGEGSKVWDDDGNEYLDFTSGIAVNCLGHAHPHWVKRVREQTETLAHCSNLFRNPNQALLAEKIVERAGPGRVFFCNSGAEANEAILKLARLYGRERSGEEGKQYHVITAKNAFHGRTFGGMAATPQEKIQDGFHPMLDGFAYAELNNLESFYEVVDEQTAAILLEPIQGEGGINPATEEFLKGIRDLCHKHDLLLLFDEVQSGAGRTGDYFGFEHGGIRGDAIAMAKGLGGGFPIGALWVDQKWASLFQPGSHGSTFGGSPLACAAALAVLEVMERDDLLGYINRASPAWHKALRGLVDKHPGRVKEFRGRGFLVAVDVEERDTVQAALRENGLLTAGAGSDAIRLLPPYTAAEEELHKAVAIFDRTLGELEKRS